VIVIETNQNLVQDDGTEIGDLEQSVLRYRYDEKSLGLKIDTVFTTADSLSDGYIADIRVMDNLVLVLESNTLPECPVSISIVDFLYHHLFVCSFFHSG